MYAHSSGAYMSGCLPTWATSELAPPTIAQRATEEDTPTPQWESEFTSKVKGKVQYLAKATYIGILQW